MNPRQEGQQKGQRPVDEHRPTKHTLGAHHLGYTTPGHLEDQVTPEEGTQYDTLLYFVPVELAWRLALHLQAHDTHHAPVNHQQTLAMFTLQVVT